MESKKQLFESQLSQLNLSADEYKAISNLNNVIFESKTMFGDMGDDDLILSELGEVDDVTDTSIPVPAAINEKTYPLIEWAKKNPAFCNVVLSDGRLADNMHKIESSPQEVAAGKPKYVYVSDEMFRTLPQEIRDRDVKHFTFQQMRQFLKEEWERDERGDIDIDSSSYRLKQALEWAHSKREYDGIWIKWATLPKEIYCCYSTVRAVNNGAPEIVYLNKANYEKALAEKTIKKAGGIRITGDDVMQSILSDYESHVGKTTEWASGVTASALNGAITEKAMKWSHTQHMFDHLWDVNGDLPPKGYRVPSLDGTSAYEYVSEEYYIYNKEEYTQLCKDNGYGVLRSYTASDLLSAITEEYRKRDREMSEMSGADKTKQAITWAMKKPMFLNAIKSSIHTGKPLISGVVYRIPNDGVFTGKMYEGVPYVYVNDNFFKTLVQRDGRIEQQAEAFNPGEFTDLLKEAWIQEGAPQYRDKINVYNDNGGLPNEVHELRAGMFDGWVDNISLIQNDNGKYKIDDNDVFNRRWINAMRKSFDEKHNLKINYIAGKNTYPILIKSQKMIDMHPLVCIGGPKPFLAAFFTDDITDVRQIVGETGLTASDIYFSDGNPSVIMGAKTQLSYGVKMAGCEIYNSVVTCNPNEVTLGSGARVQNTVIDTTGATPSNEMESTYIGAGATIINSNIIGSHVNITGATTLINHLDLNDGTAVKLTDLNLDFRKDCNVVISGGGIVKITSFSIAEDLNSFGKKRKFGTSVKSDIKPRFKGNVVINTNGTKVTLQAVSLTDSFVYGPAHISNSVISNARISDEGQGLDEVVIYSLNAVPDNASGILSSDGDMLIRISEGCVIGNRSDSGLKNTIDCACVINAGANLQSTNITKRDDGQMVVVPAGKRFDSCTYSLNEEESNEFGWLRNADTAFSGILSNVDDIEHVVGKGINGKVISDIYNHGTALEWKQLSTRYAINNVLGRNGKLDSVDAYDRICGICSCQYNGKRQIVFMFKRKDSGDVQLFLVRQKEATDVTKVSDSEINANNQNDIYDKFNDINNQIAEVNAEIERLKTQKASTSDTKEQQKISNQIVGLMSRKNSLASSSAFVYKNVASREVGSGMYEPGLMQKNLEMNDGTYKFNCIVEINPNTDNPKIRGFADALKPLVQSFETTDTDSNEARSNMLHSDGISVNRNPNVSCSADGKITYNSHDADNTQYEYSLPYSDMEHRYFVRKTESKNYRVTKSEVMPVNDEYLSYVDMVPETSKGLQKIIKVLNQMSVVASAMAKKNNTAEPDAVQLSNPDIMRIQTYLSQCSRVNGFNIIIYKDKMYAGKLVKNYSKNDSVKYNPKTHKLEKTVAGGFNLDACEALWVKGSGMRYWNASNATWTLTPRQFKVIARGIDKTDIKNATIGDVLEHSR